MSARQLPVPMARVAVVRQKLSHAVGGVEGVGALATLIDGAPTLMVAMRHRDGTTLSVQLAGDDLDRFSHVVGDAMGLILQLEGTTAGPATVQ